MKNKLLLATLLFCAACASQKPDGSAGCDPVPCTMEFKVIPVKLITTSGTEVSFKGYKIMDIATGKEIKINAELPATDQAFANTLIIADDSHRKQFAEKGTDLQLQVTRKDDQVVKVNYKIAGGKCACHVAKLNGPDEVDIDQL